MLEQVHSHSPKLTSETVERAIGRVGFKRLKDFSELLALKDLSKALVFLNELNDSGTNMVQFTKDLIHYLRRVLSLKMNPDLEELFRSDLTNDDITALKNIGTKNTPDFFIKLIKTLIRAYTDMRYSPFALVPLEVAIIESIKTSA